MKTYRKKILVFLSFCLVLSASFNVNAQEKTIQLGGDAGWPALSVADGITKGKGRFGWECLELATNSRKVSDETDLLLNFENEKNSDATFNYSVKSNSLLRTQKTVMGHYAALSRGNGKGLVLKGREGTIFGTEGNPGSFMIEFWLCPSIAENGEVIFSWRSSRIIDDYISYQMISASFYNNRLLWNFTNIFEGYTQNNGEVEVLSYSAIIPDKWAHHEISFDEESGLLEYKIDGRSEALKYITEKGREGQTIFHPYLGSPAEINICPNFTGSIDEFRIAKNSTGEDKLNRKSAGYSGINYDTYKVDGGRFETKPLLVNPSSIMRSVDIVDTVPNQTEIRYYVRSGENYFNWTDTYPEWKQIKKGEEISGVKGRFFQLACELFPDGGGRITPSVSEIKINYSETPLPLPPFKLTAKPGDSAVQLDWSYSVDDTAGGYYIYYGNRPGEYLGTDADQGPSPIKVDNITSFRLTGLKNGSIYYFAVSTYSEVDDHITGKLSEEVYSRPGRR